MFLHLSVYKPQLFSMSKEAITELRLGKLHIKSYLSANFMSEKPSKKNMIVENVYLSLISRYPNICTLVSMLISESVDLTL